MDFNLKYAIRYSTTDHGRHYLKNPSCVIEVIECQIEYRHTDSVDMT